MVNITILSGGTATNSILDIFQNLLDANSTGSSNSFIAHILPISDNGGSTSEVIRVLGGCSVGDLRSRITRLISNPALKELLSHRLPEDPQSAKVEWNSIVDGSHQLWQNINAPTKEIVRSFLIHVHTELLKRSRNSTKNFRFELASIGNLFLTGARLFCGSLDSAIELMLRVSNVDSRIQVLPCLNTNFTYHISALLEDGTIITGQSQISHPSAKLTRKFIDVNKPLLPASSDSAVRLDSIPHPPPIVATPSTSPPLRSSQLPQPLPNYSPLRSTLDQLPAYSNRLANYSTTSINEDFILSSRHLSTGDSRIDSQDVLYGAKTQPTTITTGTADFSSRSYSEDESEDESDENEFAVPSYIHPDLKKSQLHFNKDENSPLPAPISRIFYISPYGEEIYPIAQSRVIKCLTDSNLIIYSIGSLMTSIVPILILQGVGEAILANNSNGKKKKKVLLLNGSLDRETDTLDALGFLNTILKSLHYSMLVNQNKKKYPSKALNFIDDNEEIGLASFVSHVVYLKTTDILVDKHKIESLGVKCVEVKSEVGSNGGHYDLGELYERLDDIVKDRL